MALKKILFRYKNKSLQMTKYQQTIFFVYWYCSRIENNVLTQIPDKIERQK